MNDVMYLTRDDIVLSLKSMREFNTELSKTFNNFGMSIEQNTGRRNALLSQAQEHFVSKELKKRYPSTLNDGRTGKPDICIPELDIELECKLTTPSVTGSISLQADKECFGSDGKDFLYIIADAAFQSFSVLFFKSLQRSDFSDCVESAKGKVKMRKNLTHSKCTVLYGDYEPRSSKMIDKIKSELKKKKPGTKTYKNLVDRQKYWENAPESFTISLSPA